MVDSPGLSEVNTLSIIPASWEQDLNTENVFGWLRPSNEFARRAFHLIVDKMIRNPGTQLNERRFIYIHGKETVRSASVSGSDDEADLADQESDTVQFIGGFKFSTAVYPKDPAKEWFVGTGRGKPEVDVVIAPPDAKWQSNRVLGKHARIYIHKESCLTTVEALHGMEISGSTGLIHIEPRTGISSKVLEHGHQVQFGRCTYLYLRGDAMTNSKFQTSLPGFMQVHHGREWMGHPILSAPSTGAYLTFDGFTFLSGAFAGGTFGEVAAGWTQDGSVVAVKRFKRPNRQQFDQHQKIMGLIGKHANILELVHSSSNLEPTFPTIYCVYSPLALASLEDVISSYRVNVSAQISLLVDYLRGLVYMHECKGIMHRDIKPSNLGVISFRPFQGIILDLDAATTEETSDDHEQGTIPYLAPEIINLKMVSAAKRERYGRSVDVWACGMSAFCAWRGQDVKWNNFDDRLAGSSNLPGTRITNFVLEARLMKFHDRLEERVKGFKEYSEYFNLLKRMTMCNPLDRPSASAALLLAEVLAARSGEAKMIPKHSTQGTKRKIGEI